MTENEVIEILSRLTTVYTSLDKRDPVQLFNVYKEILIDEDFETVKKNVINHIKTSEFAPKISEIIPKKDKVSDMAIPSREETLEYIKSLEPKEKLSKERIAELAKEVGVVAKFKS